jgi:hypothetical protein
MAAEVHRIVKGAHIRTGPIIDDFTVRVGDQPAHILLDLYVYKPHSMEK